MEADPELTKAFQDLQGKKAETAHQLELMDAKISGTQRAIKISELTLSEITQLQPATPLYRCIGRAYFLTPKDNVETFFQTRVTKLKENIASCEENKTVLAKNLKESENSIRELVVRKKQKMSEIGKSA